MAQKTTLKEFEAVFPKLEEALVEHAKSYNLPEQALEWYKRVSSAASCLLILHETVPIRAKKGT
jgi:hypothetical protein